MSDRPQALSSSSVWHFPEEGEAHGPVLLFIADDGRMVFFCPADQATWELTPGARRTATPVTDVLEMPRNELG